MPRQDQISKWLKLLGDEAKQKQALFEKYPENFRLDNPDQATIHQDCQSLESKSPIFEESELKNALELLLTYYCKTERIAYKSGLHEVLAPFFIMRFSNLKTVYGAFCAFIDKIIPCMFTLESSIDIIYNIFQKLMMYHEPLLFNTLQSSFPSHVQVVKKWLSTAMASCFNSANLLKFWEYMLEENKPSLSLFMALSLVYRKRESLMRKSKSKKNLNIEESDIEDFNDIIKEAVAYQNNTPKSFLKLIKKALLSGPQKGNGVKDLESSSILKISEKELIKPPANYVIIDRRPLKSYTKSHFPQSFNLSSELSITTGK